MVSILQIEELRKDILLKLNKKTSPRTKSLLLSDYFNKILSSENQLLIHSYITEFIDNYISYLNNYDPFFLPVEISRNLLQQVSCLAGYSFLNEYKPLFQEVEIKIQASLKELETALTGKNKKHLAEYRLFFPVLENNTPEDFNLGILDSIIIDIKTSRQEIFIIIPSEAEIEERLSSQIKSSWNAALNYIRQKKNKLHRHHKVIIQFDKRAGFYMGESLGITLTLAFIEKLLELYNTPYLVKINNNIAATGAVIDNGKIPSVSKEVIENKVEVVFYSDINIFVVPKEDEIFANEKLDQLKERYPYRNLEIIGVKDITDFLDRRTLVEIKKQNPVIRTAKAIKKNYPVLILLFLLILLSTYYAIRDFDSNPAILQSEYQTLFVKNKSGRLLWKTGINYPKLQVLNENTTRIFQRLIDINKDGQNEILLANEYNSINEIYFGIRCLNYKGKEIWHYVFKDTVSSAREDLIPEYISFLLDIDSTKNILYCFAVSNSSYPCAIYKLNLKTGKRLHGTFWHTGHILQGYLTNINHSKNKQLVCAGANNSYEMTTLFVLSESSIDGSCPAIKDYKLNNKKLTKFKSYIMFEKNDYSKLHNQRYFTMAYGDFFVNKGLNKFFMNVNCGDNKYYRYEINNNMKDIDVIITDDFRVARDTLVAHGVLKPPYTDTKEYREILKSQILYWNGKKFVHRIQERKI